MLDVFGWFELNTWIENHDEKKEEMLTKLEKIEDRLKKIEERLDVQKKVLGEILLCQE